MKSLLLSFILSSLCFAQLPTKDWEIKLVDVPAHFFGHSSVVSQDGSLAITLHSSDTQFFWISRDGNILFQESVTSAVEGASTSAVVYQVSSNILIYGTDTTDFSTNPSTSSYQRISLVKNPDETVTKTILETGEGKLRALHDDPNQFTKGYYQTISGEEGVLLTKYSYTPSSIELSPATTGIDDNDNLVISWESLAGRTYQVQSSQALDGTWKDEGNAVTGNGSVISYSTPRSNTTNFLRVVEQ